MFPFHDDFPLPRAIMCIIWDYLPVNHQTIHSDEKANRLALVAREAWGWHQRLNPKGKLYDHCYPTEDRADFGLLKKGLELCLAMYAFPLTDKWTLAAWYKMYGRDRVCQLIAPFETFLMSNDIHIGKMRYALVAMTQANDIVSIHRCTHRFRQVWYSNCPKLAYQVGMTCESMAIHAADAKAVSAFHYWWPIAYDWRRGVPFGLSERELQRKKAPQQIIDTINLVHKR